VAESFARIFFRNCIATGELYPVESPVRVIDTVRTGDTVTVDVSAATLTIERTGAVLQLTELGDARDVIGAGGLFEYARRTGMMN
jgi:3-isopropylmalate/(R)-2-methylmalate dehydratase small subunit